MSEGDIRIEAEDGDGSFRGRHEGKGQDIAGQCFEEDGGLPHRIMFILPDRNPQYLYVGVIDVSGDPHKIKGRRFDFTTVVEAKRADDQAEILADDDWTAERPVTFRQREEAQLFKGH